LNFYVNDLNGGTQLFEAGKYGDQFNRDRGPHVKTRIIHPSQPDFAAGAYQDVTGGLGGHEQVF